MDPWMRPQELACIERHLPLDSSLLEWGAGGSTIHFGKRQRRLVSIKHDTE